MQPSLLGELTGSIEQSQCIGVVPNHYGNGVIVKHLENLSYIHPKRTDVIAHTVGTYSLGNLLVVYDINKQVWEFKAMFNYQ